MPAVKRTPRQALQHNRGGTRRFILNTTGRKLTTWLAGLLHEHGVMRLLRWAESLDGVVARLEEVGEPNA